MIDPADEFESVRSESETSSANGHHRARQAVVSWAPTVVAIALLIAIAARRHLDETNADALLPVLMSTQHFTVFYWGQDRLANLIPLLAMPVRDEIWNFRVQSILLATAFFSLIAVFVRWHLARTRSQFGPYATATITFLVGLTVMWPMTSLTGYRFIFEQIYCLSILLWVVAASAWARRRRAVGATLLQLATLVNPSIVLLMPFEWLIDDQTQGRRRRNVEFAVASVIAFVVTNVAARLLSTGRGRNPYDKFELATFPDGAKIVAGHVWHSLSQPEGLVSIVVLASVVAVRAPRFQRRLTLTYVAAPVFATAWWIIFSTNAWIIRNAYEFRYFFPFYVTFMLYAAIAVCEIAGLVRAALPHSNRSSSNAASPSAAAAWGCVAVLVVAWSLVRVSRVEIPLIAASQQYVVAAKQFEVRLASGPYASLWPAVVAARAEHVELLGVGYRSEAIIHEITKTIEGAERRHEPVRVICTVSDPISCIDEFEQATGDDWELLATVNSAPLIIEIERAPSATVAVDP